MSEYEEITTNGSEMVEETSSDSPADQGDNKDSSTNNDNDGIVDGGKNQKAQGEDTASEVAEMTDQIEQMDVAAKDKDSANDGDEIEDPSVMVAEAFSPAQFDASFDEQEQEQEEPPPPPAESAEGEAAANDEKADKGETDAAVDATAESATEAAADSSDQEAAAALAKEFHSVPAPPVDLPPSAVTSLPLSNESRITSLSKLRAYEAARRSAYKSKLSSSSLYWRSFRELLHSSIEETERAEQIFKNAAESNTSYAISLRAVSNDTLDEQGRPVVDPKKRKKLLESREKRRAAASAGPIAGSGASAAAAAAADEAKKAQKSRLHVSDKSFDRQQLADKGGASGILDALAESQGIMADRFAEYAKYVYDEAVPEIVEIRQALVLEVTLMEKLGDAIQEELDAAEKEVHEAWKSYYASAEKSLSFANTKDMRRGAVSAPVDASPSTVSYVANCADVWVQEMRYRMAVAFLSTAWDKSSKELASLFGTLKSTECSRRFRLRELLVAFVNRQERLWSSLPALVAPVTKDLVDKPLDRENIEAEVQASIRVRAQGLQREEAKAKKLMGKKEEVGPGLNGVDPSSGNYNLTSPLVSDLLVKANVIEKKSSSVMSSWKTTLAIVTADSFLHLFEIPPSAKVSNGSAPEVAFHALVPPVEVPTEESAKTYVSGKIIKDWFKMIHPAASIALPNCSISFKDEEDTCTFEVTEKVPNSTAASAFRGKTTTRKISLRTLSNDETKEWIAAIQANK